MPDDPRRLVELAEQGDRDAAEALWQHARRGDDLERAAIAAVALADLDKLVAIADEAWARGHDAARTRCCAALGFTLDDAAAAALDAVLEAAHDRRKLRCLSRADMLRCAADAIRSPRAFAVRDAGRLESASTISRAKSTVCLAVDLHHSVVVGAAGCSARQPSPGSGWYHELAPWRPEASTIRSRVDGWAIRRSDMQHADSVVLPRVGDPVGGANEEVSALDFVIGHIASDVSPASWQTICDAADAWGDEREADVDHLAEALDVRWPDRERRARVDWLKRIGGKRPRPKPHWKLVRHLDLGSMQKALERDVIERAVASGWLEQITEVTLPTGGARQQDDLVALLEAPTASSLRVVRAGALLPTLDCARALLGSPSLASLRHLELGPLDRLGAFAKSRADEALPAVTLESLESLELVEMTLRAPILERLFAAPELGRLRRLRITTSQFASIFGVTLEPEVALALFASQHLRCLETVELDEVTIAAATCTALTRQQPVLASLRRLALNRLDLYTAHALAGWAQLETLTTLDLSGLRIARNRGRDPVDDVVLALIGSARLGSLRRLDLSGIGSELRDVVAQLRLPGTLRELVLDGAALSARSLRALLARDDLPPLEVLSLAESSVGNEGAHALVRSEALRGLRRLDLRGCRIGKRGLEALAGSHLRGAVEGLSGTDDLTAWHES